MSQSHCNIKGGRFKHITERSFLRCKHFLRIIAKKTPIVLIIDRKNRTKRLGEHWHFHYIIVVRAKCTHPSLDLVFKFLLIVLLSSLY